MADSATLNQINSSRILQKVWRQEGISRIELSRELGLDKSTISKITQQLLDNEILSLTGSQSRDNKSGRPRTGLTINQQLGLIGGIQIQSQLCRMLLVKLDGSIVFQKEYPFKEDDQSISDYLSDKISELENEAAQQNKTLLGTGIGFPGMVNSYTGEIIQSYPLQIFEPFPLSRELETRHPQTAILLENDANCCCWGELSSRKEKRDRNSIALFGEFRKTNIGLEREPGIGIGLGIVIRNKVLHGDDFTVGEFRSLFWKEGNMTQFSISDSQASTLQSNPDLRRELFSEMSRNISLLVNCLNITRVVISGDLSFYIDEIKPHIQKAIQENWLYSAISQKECQVDAALFGNFSVAYGAAGFFIEKLFSIPDIHERPDEAVGIRLLREVKNL